jgi:hypothetical protein
MNAVVEAFHEAAQTEMLKVWQPRATGPALGGQRRRDALPSTRLRLAIMICALKRLFSMRD